MATAEQHAVDVLLRHQRGEATPDDIAEALKQGPMYLLLSAKDAQTMMDGEAPDLFGMHTDDGFLPFAYTSSEIAHASAVRNGFVQPNEASATYTKDWLTGVYGFLAQDFAGIMIDHGEDHELYLDNTQTALLYALVSVEEFGSIEHVYVVCGEETGHVRTLEMDDGRTQVFAFGSEDRAERGVPLVEKSFDRAEIRRLPMRGLLELLVETRADLLTVNVKQSDERTYFARHFPPMLAANRAEHG